MIITVKEAFEKRLHHSRRPRLTYHGHLVYQLSRSITKTFESNLFIIHFDERGLLPIEVSGNEYLIDTGVK